MPKQQPKALQDALAAFAPNLVNLLKHRGISQSELWRQLKRRGHKVSQKTVNNLANAKHSSEIGNLAAVADYFGVPLWVMLVPALPPDMVDGAALARLDRLVKDYIACAQEDRNHLENVAAAYVKRKIT